MADIVITRTERYQKLEHEALTYDFHFLSECRFVFILHGLYIYMFLNLRLLKENIKFFIKLFYSPSFRRILHENINIKCFLYSR